jgi:hypothetical protein
MKVNFDEAQKIIREKVSDYLERNAQSTGVPIQILFGEEREHVVNIGTSIMMNRLGFNTYPGSFVQAVLDNDLAGAFGRADHINRQCLGFYSTMVSCLGIDISPE